MDRDVNPRAEASELVYRPAPVFRAEHGEDRITRTIEMQAAKVPSEVFLFLGLGAMAFSFGAELAHRTRLSRFVGMWPAPLLVMGLYNKMVKLMGPR